MRECVDVCAGPHSSAYNQSYLNLVARQIAAGPCYRVLYQHRSPARLTPAQAVAQRSQTQWIRRPPLRLRHSRVKQDFVSEGVHVSTKTLMKLNGEDGECRITETPQNGLTIAKFPV